MDSFSVFLDSLTLELKDDNDHLDEEEVHVDGHEEGDEEEGGGSEQLVHLINGDDYLPVR